MNSFRCLKASPADVRKVCVHLHSENYEPMMWFSQTTPEEHSPTPPPCRWPARTPLRTLTKFSSFGAVSVMLCCFTPPAYSSAPLRSSVCYPSIGLVVNIIYIRIFCGHISVFHNFDQNCIVLKSGWSSTSTTARMPASSLVFLCLRLTPLRHHQADGQLSPLYPPSPCFSSFGAACVNLCCLPPSSLVRNIRLRCLI